MTDRIVIAGAKRTPMAGFQGEFSSVTASELGGAAIKAAVEDAKLDPAKIDEVIMGNVLSAGQGQAPARQAAFSAGLDKGVPATTLNKMCGSGMKSTMVAFDQLWKMPMIRGVSWVHSLKIVRRNSSLHVKRRMLTH